MGDLTLSVVNGRRKPSKYFGGVTKATDAVSLRLASQAMEAGVAGVSPASIPAVPIHLIQTECGISYSTGGVQSGGEGLKGPEGARITSGLTNGSTAKVSKVSPALTESLKRALARLADDDVERDRAAWVSWYEGLIAPKAPKQP